MPWAVIELPRWGENDGYTFNETKNRVYLNRAPRGDGNHRDSRGDFVAGGQSREGEQPRNAVEEQPCADGQGNETLRRLGVTQKAFTVCQVPSTPSGCSGSSIEWTSNTVQVETALPPSLVHGQVEHDTNFRLYNEKCGHTLASDVNVDWVPNGTQMSMSADIGVCNVPGGTIPTGTEVDVYYLHWDSVTEGVSSTGEIQFTQPILGVVLKRPSPNFVPTDSLLGGADTTYTSSETRGFECAAGDVQLLTISADAKSVYFTAGVRAVVFACRDCGADRPHPIFCRPGR